MRLNGKELPVGDVRKSAVEAEPAVAPLRDIPIFSRTDMFRRIFEISASPLLVLAPDAPRFTIVAVNDAYLAATMRSREDLVGEALFEALPDNPAHAAADGVSNLRASLDRVVADRMPDTMPIQRYDVAGPDGTFQERWWDPVNTPVLNGSGSVEAIIHRVADVTQERARDAELRESEARVRALTDNLPAGMVFQMSTGRDGCERRFLYVSQSHERLTGVPASAVLADPSIPYELIVPEDREALARAEVEAITTQSSFDVEVRFRRADGVIRWCRIISARREQDDGSLIWDGMQIDTTDQKLIEAQLRQLTETLEQRVVERTTALQQAHEQLRHSQKLEAMGQLTGNVSHDFNNLLSPIIGSLDLLQRRSVGGEREQRLLGGALQSAERARVLVQRLLAFARRQPLQPKPVNIGALVSGMAELIASTSGPQIKVVIDIADDLPAAVADPNQIEMAVLNLSVNARDAMPEGGTLRITVVAENVGAAHRSKLRPGPYVHVSVADTGIGMNEPTLQSAVEPFFSTKGIGCGTGLGLSMVHGLAAQLGGALTIDSREGLGTNVQIWLPASADPEPNQKKVEPSERERTHGTVLLVDDEELVRSTTADMLSDLGYAVVEASSAEDALRLMEDGLLFDALVTDHLMPGMMGTELARQVSAQRPSTSILVISGYADVDGIAPEFRRLAKPFRQAELLARLNEMDGRSPG